MRKITLAMNQSLDGYIICPNGEMDWLTRIDADSRPDISSSLQSVNTISLSNVTHPQYLFI